MIFLSLRRSDRGVFTDGEENNLPVVSWRRAQGAYLANSNSIANQSFVLNQS